MAWHLDWQHSVDLYSKRELVQPELEYTKLMDLL